MEIKEADSKGRSAWNEFISVNYPPIGAFMLTYEWGEFQQAQGREVRRYFVVNKNGVIAAAFTLVYHQLLRGLFYGYTPRGPVIAKEVIKEGRASEVLSAIKEFANKFLSRFIFLRLEPPFNEKLGDVSKKNFYIPNYYVQPRYNLAVSLLGTEEEILKSFHPSTRSNIRRAENRGVTVQMKSSLAGDDYKQFFGMIRDTIKRNSGVNAYPSEKYFRSLFETIPPLVEKKSKERLSIGIFYGFQNNEPAGMHFVLFFGDTATYLYGASFSNKLSSKVTTYLHFMAMKEAKKRGLKYYDLGGIDESRWSTLTNFKRQFKGKEFEYVGNIDIVLRPIFYFLYNIFRKIKGVF